MVEKRALPRAPAIHRCPGKLQMHESQDRERLTRKEGKILDATGTLQTAAAAVSEHSKEARREMSQDKGQYNGKRDHSQEDAAIINVPALSHR